MSITTLFTVDSQPAFAGLPVTTSSSVGPPSELPHTNHSYMEQVHRANHIWVESTGSVCQRQVDSQATSNQNLTLWVKTADCLPVLWYHPAGGVGVIHAGRRGTQQQIVSQTLSEVMSKFGQPTSSSKLILWFGPAICAQCYQIDRATNTHFDLVAENRRQLERLLSPDKFNLTVSSLCTLETPPLSSYRRNGPGCDHHYWGIRLTS